MRKRLFSIILLLSMTVVGVWAQSAILVRNQEPISAFNGADAFKNAVNAAEASGDVIVLSLYPFMEKALRKRRPVRISKANWNFVPMVPIPSTASISRVCIWKTISICYKTATVTLSVI